jgi:alkaline phosphatase
MTALVEGNNPEDNSFAIIEIDKKLNIRIKGFYHCEDRLLKYRTE